MNDVTVHYQGVEYDLHDIMRYIFDLQDRVQGLEHLLDNAQISYYE